MAKAGSDAAPPAKDEPRPTLVDTQGAPGAPFLFFEAPGSIFSNDGIVTISLAAVKTIPMSNGGAQTLPVAVGYLKGTRNAFIALHKAIEDAFLLDAKTDGQKN